MVWRVAALFLLGLVRCSNTCARVAGTYYETHADAVTAAWSDGEGSWSTEVTACTVGAPFGLLEGTTHIPGRVTVACPVANGGFLIVEAIYDPYA